MTFEDLLTWDIVFGLVSLAIVVSNSFAIFVFTRRQFRRKLTHYLPINLAVTDVVVGAIALPLFMISLLNYPGDMLSRFYQSFDIIAGVTSLSSIPLISLERLYAIGWPWKHRLLKRKHYVIGITFTWLYAIVFMVLLRFVSTLSGLFIMGVHVMIWGMGLPLMITLVACIMICIMKKRSERILQRRSHVQQNNKLVKTLLMVTVVFWMSWLPYTVLSIALTYSFSKGKCYNVLLLTMLLKFLHYSNSFANPIIYAFRVNAFQSSLREIFCTGRRAQKVNRVLPAISQTPGRLELQELRIENATLEKHCESGKTTGSF